MFVLLPNRNELNLKALGIIICQSLPWDISSRQAANGYDDDIRELYKGKIEALPIAKGVSATLDYSN